jgi:hypothetical protein
MSSSGFLPTLQPWHGYRPVQFMAETQRVLQAPRGGRCD